MIGRGHGAGLVRGVVGRGLGCGGWSGSGNGHGVGEPELHVPFEEAFGSCVIDEDHQGRVEGVYDCGSAGAAVAGYRADAEKVQEENDKDCAEDVGLWSPRPWRECSPG
jgi:hypothetical protein